MENALLSFQYDAEPCRVVMIAGEPWWVATDLARLLGYRMAPHMMRMIPEEWKGIHLVDTLGGQQSMNIIAEGGMWLAIGRSKRPEAVKIQKWMFGEVMPSIRRTGKYEIPGYDPPTLMIADHDPGKLTAFVGVVREARRLFGLRAARRVWMDLGLPAAVADAHGEYSEGLAEPIKIWLEGRREVTIEEVADGLGILLDLDDALRMRIGAVLRTLGWFPKVKRRGHATAKVFSPEHAEG